MYTTMQRNMCNAVQYHSLYTPSDPSMSKSTLIISAMCNADRLMNKLFLVNAHLVC